MSHVVATMGRCPSEHVVNSSCCKRIDISMGQRMRYKNHSSGLVSSLTSTNYSTTLRDVCFVQVSIFTTSFFFAKVSVFLLWTTAYILIEKRLKVGI